MQATAYEIEIKNLVKRYKDFLAVDHLSLQVKPGEIFALLGPNGSGKTTLINCLLSLLRYEKGEIKIFGQPMQANSTGLKQKIGVVPQDIAVYDELTVGENVDYFCSLYVPDRARRKAYVDEALDFVQLQEFRKRMPRKLSGGLLRRLNLACGIVHKPKLIILDEPTVSVDPQSRNRIIEGIRHLRDAGSTILYTTHYMEEVENLCDRLVIIDKGQALVTGSVDEIIDSSNLANSVEMTIYDLDQTVLQELAQLPDILNCEYKAGKLSLQIKHGGLQLLDLLHFLDERQVQPVSIVSDKPTLNDVFLEITGKELRDDA